MQCMAYFLSRSRCLETDEEQEFLDERVQSRIELNEMEESINEVIGEIQELAEE